MKGIYAMSAAMVFLVANDALVKYVSQSIPTLQVIFFRSVLTSVILLSLAGITGMRGRLQGWRNPPVVVRSVLDALATAFYLVSLSHLPIANATAINMAAPVILILLAILTIRQRVDLGRWCAVVVGFSGVILVVQPQADSFNGYSLLCLLGTFLHAGRDLITRSIDKTIPPVAISLCTSSAVTMLAGLGTLFSPWEHITWSQCALISTASLFLSIGYLLITISMRYGDISVIAPFRYAGLFFALLLGWGIWGELPNALAWTGILLLLGAGGYVLHCERMRNCADLEPDLGAKAPMEEAKEIELRREH